MTFERKLRDILTSQDKLGNQNAERVAVIGGGFYGCITALKLARKGMKVVLFEKNSDVFMGTSGTYGTRLHTGPHYPRSPATRNGCREAFRQFLEEFPSLIGDIEVALYALADKDVDGIPSRVSKSKFDSVCRESEQYAIEDPNKWGVNGVSGLWSVYEPCVYLDRAQILFRKLLKNNKNIELVFNHHVKNIIKKGEDSVLVDNQVFDWVVNCTYFTSFSDKKVGGADVIFQPCLTLTYEDTYSNENEKPFTFTVMDGWFPCLMPILSGLTKEKNNRYMLYHAKYTILGSYGTYKECEDHVNRVSTEWVEENVRHRMEKHMSEFLPSFTSRFKYTGYLINSATKLRTGTEFRGALVWSSGRIIHEFSGKLHEVVTASREVCEIIRNGRFQDRNTVSKNFNTELQSKSFGAGACDMRLEKWDVPQ